MGPPLFHYFILPMINSHLNYSFITICKILQLVNPCMPYQEKNVTRDIMSKDTPKYQVRTYFASLFAAICSASQEGPLQSIQ